MSSSAPRSRALVADPDVLLADEPTGNLDEAATGGVLDVFRDAHRAGTTIVVVTHNARVAARADRRYEMAAGRLRLAEVTAADPAGS